MSAEVFGRWMEGELRRQLNEECNEKVGEFLVMVETKTGRKREELVGGVAVVLGLYLLFGFFAEVLCNGIGFAYPAYASFLAIESPQKTDDTQWLTYWVVFAVFSIMDFFAKIAMKYVPFYWLFKCIFLLYLYLPVFRGAEHLYNNHLKGIMTRLFTDNPDQTPAVPPDPEEAEE